MKRREQIEQVAHLIKGKSRNREFIAFVQGALWADAHLWKSAGGEDLPEIDREVVVFTQKEGLSSKVSIAHRPDPKGWNGRNILTGEVNHYTPKTYDKGGWSIPDVKIWLDAPLPLKEDEV